MKVNRYLYHATYMQFLDSILANGLGNTDKKMYSDSKGRGVVYLADDSAVAYSYAECADWLDDIDNADEYLNNIVVLKIDANKLDKNNLFIDENVLDNDGATFEYHGIIPKEAIINIVDEQDRPIEKLNNLF